MRGEGSKEEGEQARNGGRAIIEFEEKLMMGGRGGKERTQGRCMGKGGKTVGRKHGNWKGDAEKVGKGWKDSGKHG